MATNTPLQELQKLFPQVAEQLKCLSDDNVPQQSSASVLRRMRELLSDPCHMLPESLLKSDIPPSGPEFLQVQLKPQALEELTSLVSEPTFKCAPRFPGHTPSLINVGDKKGMIGEPDLYPGYVIPKISFCFDVSDHVMDSGRTKAGLISPRFVEPGKVFVNWGNEEKEEDRSKLIELSKARVVVFFKRKTGSDLDDPLHTWCVVKTAFTTKDSSPKEFVKFKSDRSDLEFIISNDPADADFFLKDVITEADAKSRLLDQCHEYTILQGVASRLAESFDKLSRISGEFERLKALDKEVKDLEKQVKDAELKKGFSQATKPADDLGKEAKDLKAKKAIWEEQKGTHDSLQDASNKWRLSPHCGYNTILESLKKAWTRLPCVRSFEGHFKSKSGKSIFETRFNAALRLKIQPFQLVPDPYHLTQSSSGPASRQHYFPEASARADCLLVGDHVAASSLDVPHQYVILANQSHGKSKEDWCFKTGGSDDIYSIRVDIGLCPSWRSVLIKDNFFELDFDGRGNNEIFKIDDIEFLSHVQMHIHFKCSKHHHKAFLHSFKNKDSSMVLFRPFGCESLGRFHASFHYLLEICYSFCHIIAKGLLDRHDHIKCQGSASQHAYDSPDFSHGYDSYAKFNKHEGCHLIYDVVHVFLQEADARRMRLLDFMPYGVQFRDDPTYKSCLSVANQVQDTLFLLKETFKNLFKPTASSSGTIANPLTLQISSASFELNLHNQQNIDAFDRDISHRHNQRCMNRSICCYVSQKQPEDYVIKAFESFERFVDPFFVLQNADNQADHRDMRRLFANLNRSIYSLELGHVCSFSTGSPQPLGVGAIFLALRCRHNTNLLPQMESPDLFAHHQRYFELICFCAKFVERNAAQLRLAFPALHSFGFASTPNLHPLVQVKMRDSTGKNRIVQEVLKLINNDPSTQFPLNRPFKRRMIEDVERKNDVVEFLAFLDSSRTLISEFNYEKNLLESLFWIPTPEYTKGKGISGPNCSLLWKGIDQPYSLTAVHDSKSGKQMLHTQTQALKFQFLQFASQLLEANFYKTSEHQIQPSADLLAMWHDKNRDERLTEEAKKIFMCILPPEDFAKHGFKYHIDSQALAQRMKDECSSVNFDKLDRKLFKHVVDGEQILPFFLPQYHGESLEDFLKLDVDGTHIELCQHIRTLAHGIDESAHSTFTIFWQLRLDDAARAEAYRKICYFLNRNSIDKGFEILEEFVKDYCHWIKSDPQTHCYNHRICEAEPQPLECLVSGLSLAIDCLASLPRCVSCSSENYGSSPAEMYQKILDFVLLDSRPGMPLIHMLHSLDGTMNVSSDVYGFLPSTQIALALQPSFVRLVGMGFALCSLHFPSPLILDLEERSWFILMRSFESSAIFLSNLSGDSLNNVAFQIAWVAAARALLQCADFWRSGSASDHWQPDADAPDLCRIVEFCLECFKVPMNVCGNDCIIVAMDLIASILPLCPCFHDRVSSNMCLFRRFASLLLGSTGRATTSMKSSALNLLGVCFETGLQPHDLDEFLLTSRPNAPELQFLPAGHAFGGGPLLNLGGIDLAAVDTVIKALHATASSKLVPWFVSPLSPTVAIAQICRSTMLFGKHLAKKQVLYNVRCSPHIATSSAKVDLWFKKFVDCEWFGEVENEFVSNTKGNNELEYLHQDPTIPAKDVCERSAVLENSMWLHVLTTALVHLKGMLVSFISFSLNKELSFADSLSIPQQEAMFFPHFATSLNHPVAPLVVRPSRSGNVVKRSQFIVSNPLCVPVFVHKNGAVVRIEPNSEAEVDTCNDPVAYKSFLSILQVLRNGRLNLVQKIYEKECAKGDSPINFSDRESSDWNVMCKKLLKTVDAELFKTSVSAARMKTPADDDKQQQEKHFRFSMDRMLFLSDLCRLTLIEKKNNDTMSFVVQVATSLAAIPARQASEISFKEVLPPLMGNFWPLVIALYVPGNLKTLKENDLVHKLVDHLSDLFSGLSVELTGLSYKIASNCLDDHPSFPISDVLAHLDIQHVLPSVGYQNLQNFRALDFTRRFLDNFSQFLSSSGFCSDPASMQIKKERDVAIEYFLSFFSVQSRSAGLTGIPVELLQQFVLNEATIQTLCLHNFRTHFGKVPMLLLPKVHPNTADITVTHPFPSGKCSFDEHWYLILKKLLFGLNFHNTSLVTSLYMLDFIRSFYSATFRRSKFLSMGFSSFHPQPSKIAEYIKFEYEPQHTFIQTVVSVISSMGCMSNPEFAKIYFPTYGRDHAFIKKCFEFLCFVAEDNFVVECVDPAALLSLQSEMSVTKSRLQDMEFSALRKRSSWTAENFNPPHRPSRIQHSIERTLLSSSSTSRMQAVYFQNLKTSSVASFWKKGDMCMVQCDGKFYPAQVTAVTKKETEPIKYEVSFTDYEHGITISAPADAKDMKAFNGQADVFNFGFKREIPVSSFVNIFNENSDCALLNQDKNTFLRKMTGAGANPFLFDNQDLLLLKAAFREDFRVSGAKHDINGVYELCSFSGSAEHSKYRMNPALFGPQGSHYTFVPSQSKFQKPGSLDLPELIYVGDSWVITQGGKAVASLLSPKVHKYPELKHCLSDSNWIEIFPHGNVSSKIRLELLANSSSPAVSSIRRRCLVRIIHKTNLIDVFKTIYQEWKTSVNLVFESLCLYSKSPIFMEQRDCTLPSFLGCFSAMISLLPRDRAAIYSPPLRSICLVLAQYLRDTNPDDPNKFLTSPQLSAVGVILSTFSLAAEVPDLFDPSKSSFVTVFIEYVLDRIYRELVCFCDSSILPVLKDQSSFCCSRSLDAILSMCSSASIATSILSLASVLGVVAHCHHAIHLWESEKSLSSDQMSMKIWKIKDSLTTYRSLGSTSNAHERSIQHRNYVKILQFLSLVCERSRREETFSLRSNVMLGNTMHSLVNSVSSSIDQQLPMDALNCVRLALECWPRIESIIDKLKQSYEPGVNVSAPSPQDISLGDLHELSAWISLTCNSMCTLPTVFQPKLNEEMKMLVGHLVQCFYQYPSVVTDLEERKLYHTSRYCGIKHLFWSSEENPSDDQLVNERGRSVYVHQPLLSICGSISHICYCLQTLYFFKSGQNPIVLKKDGQDEDCDQDISKNAIKLLENLVEIFISAQETCCKTPDAEHFLHRFADKEMTCFISAIDSLFELCLRIRLHPNRDPHTSKKAQSDNKVIHLVQKLHPSSRSSRQFAGSDSSKFCKQCENWRSRSFNVYKRIFSLLQECGDSLDLPKSLQY